MHLGCFFFFSKYKMFDVNLEDYIFIIILKREKFYFSKIIFIDFIS